MQTTQSTNQGGGGGGDGGSPIIEVAQERTTERLIPFVVRGFLLCLVVNVVFF